LFTPARKGAKLRGESRINYCVEKGKQRAEGKGTKWQLEIKRAHRGYKRNQG